MDFFVFIIALCGILTPVMLLAIIFSYTNTSEKRFHETVQKMIDNGQELNQETLSAIPGYKKVMPRNDVRNGVNTLGVGVGLIFLGWIGLGSVITGVGFLVACIGGAILYNGRLSEKTTAADNQKQLSE